MRRRILQALAGIAGLLLLALVGLSVWAGRPVEAPYPAVVADRSGPAVARGHAIFDGTCGACHVPAGGSRATGAPMTEIPSLLGRFYSRNLTRDPQAGIGRLSDREIARLLRFGVTHDGRAAAMPTYGFSDADVAAVLGFLRSDDPLFAPDGTASPPSRPTILGRVLIRAGIGSAASRPAEGLTAPTRAPSVAYGKYLAHDVFDCAGCHTPGYSPGKTRGPELFRGGFEFPSPEGGTVRAPNLTPDGTGLAGWTARDLEGVLLEGKKPDGAAVRAPMPRFAGLGADEVAALLAYLQSLPPQHGTAEPTHPKREVTARDATIPPG